MAINQKSLVCLFVLLFTSALANAGQQLHFRAASFSPQNYEQMIPLGSHLAEVWSTEYFVVQFQDIISAADQAELKKYGIEVMRYIPDNAYLVKSNHGTIQDFSEQVESVAAAIPYFSTLRLSPDFVKRSVFNQHQRQKITIQIFEKKALATIVEALQEMLGVEVLMADGKTIFGVVELASLDEVATLEGVEWVQPFEEIETMELPIKSSAIDVSPFRDYRDLTGYETGTKIMNFDSAWSAGYTGAGEVVSFADTGLDTGRTANIHPDFRGQVKSGHAFGFFTQTWEDPMGHGTHVGGSIVSTGAESGGQLKGGAYNAELVVEGLWSKVLNNLSIPSPLSKLWVAAYKDGARIHSNSWGSPQNPGAYSAFSAQVDEYMWENPDMLVIFAAGNGGVDNNRDGRIDNGSVSSPGTAKNCLTVGASENLLAKGGVQRKLGDLLDGKPWGVEPLASDTLSNNPNGLAAFSSVGPTSDGRIKPEVVAPGSNIVSACSQVNGANPLWGNYNDYYCYSGGTSMSTPLVAGAAAVAREYLRKEMGMSQPSAAAVKAVLMHTAFDMYPGQYGEVGKSSGQELLAPGPNNHQGYGRVDMNAVVNSGFALHDDTQGVGRGETTTFSGYAQGGLKVTLVYTDAPGSASAARALVNDLDLRVIDDSGKTFRSESRVNNSEQIVIPQMTGGFTVEVAGYNVPSGRAGKQPFALIFSTQ